MTVHIGYLQFSGSTCPPVCIQKLDGDITSKTVLHTSPQGAKNRYGLNRCCGGYRHAAGQDPVPKGKTDGLTEQFAGYHTACAGRVPEKAAVL